MKIAIVGTGYVGLVTGACLAEAGNTVWCVDKEEAKVNRLTSGEMTIFEPGLQEIVIKNSREGRLYFTTHLKPALENTLFVFITVGTPPGPNGAADLTGVYEVAREIGQQIKQYSIIVDKSTVPVGTAQTVRKIIAEELAARGAEIPEFEVVSNPEFLKEGGAVEDFMHPDRVIIGTRSVKAAELMKKLYQPFVDSQKSILIMDEKSAEITKYAANAMLAARISFINEISRLCDRVGADIVRVRQGIGTDSRIGMHFLNAGAGYGGSCFPKDVKELIQSGHRFGVEMEIAQAVENVNDSQKHYMSDMICRHFCGNLTRKKIAVWGLAFKPQTDDVRESPAITLIRSLVQRDAVIVAYDPEAVVQARSILVDCSEHIEYADHMMAALDGADALVLITEWCQFQQPDFTDMKRRMREPLIFDGRNQYDPKQMEEMGFTYYCIGRGCYV